MCLLHQKGVSPAFSTFLTYYWFCLFTSLCNSASSTILIRCGFHIYSFLSYIQVKNMNILVFFTLFWSWELCSSYTTVNVTYLRKVKRSESAAVTDYYFCCQSEGKVLQWAVNRHSVSGFYVTNEKNSTFSAGNNMNYTTTLLSVVRIRMGYAKFDSVLIVSLHDHQTLHVSCTNNDVISTTSNMNHPRFEDKKNDLRELTAEKDVAFEYVMATPLVRGNESGLTHIFVCRTISPSLLVGVGRHALGFSSNDKVGNSRISFSPVKLQIILASRYISETTSFVFVTEGSAFSIKCSSQVNAERINSSENIFPSSPQSVSTQSTIDTSSTALKQTTTKVSSPVTSTATPVLEQECKNIHVLE